MNEKRIFFYNEKNRIQQDLLSLLVSVNVWDLGCERPFPAAGQESRKPCSQVAHRHLPATNNPRTWIKLSSSKSRRTYRPYLYRSLSSCLAPPAKGKDK